MATSNIKAQLQAELDAITAKLAEYDGLLQQKAQIENVLHILDGGDGVVASGKKRGRPAGSKAVKKAAKVRKTRKGLGHQTPEHKLKIARGRLQTALGKTTTDADKDAIKLKLRANTAELAATGIDVKAYDKGKAGK